MYQFTIDEERCVQCGLCAQDCPMGVIDMPEYPVLERDGCIKCQHCLAVCPTAALSLLGVDPDDSILLKGNFPDSKAMATLIKGRRSVRKYKDESLALEVIRELLDVVWNAPTGVNNLSTLLTVVADKDSLDALRGEIYERLEALITADTFPESELAYYLRWAAQGRKENGGDIIFRGAPHLIVASAPHDGPSPMPDTLIMLSYFELMAQTMGIGTLWNGMVKAVLEDVLPDIRTRLGIPENHKIGYVMLFGRPAVKYHRTINRGPANANFPTWHK